MIHPAIPLALPLALLALAAPAAMAADADPRSQQGPQVLFLRQRVVIRVPRMPVAAPAQRKPAPGWKEHKGPKCLQSQDLAGALIAAPAVVDLLLVDGRRMRAKLDRDCRSADFYSGLYLKLGPDGRVCADRDAFRVRSGARCEINSFRRLSLAR